jgi:hypothetical protein
MAHPDFPELIGQLHSAVNNGAGRATLHPIANRLADKIRRKHIRLFNHENISLVQWVNAVRNAPNQIAVYSANRDFNVIQHRDIDIVFHYKPRGNTLYSPFYNLDIETVRTHQRLILENPYIALNPNNLKEGVQSWSRPKSISFTYKRHLPHTNYKGKSRFLPGIDIRSIESILFHNAYGLMNNLHQIFFYGLFDGDIGNLSNNHRTRYVALQCDRILRPLRRWGGTQVQLHSYPISRAELINDFSGNGNYYIPFIDNLVFNVP